VKIAGTRGELAKARAALEGRVAVVMTMGALHEGHAALLRAARKSADSVIATIFVNPLQFGPAEDFTRYPRTLDADLAVCAAEGVDAVFTPTPEGVYPGGEPSVRIEAVPLGDELEGAIRPGHFSGVLTVVHKLLRLTDPDVSFYGEKDYQQLTLIKAMAADLDMGVEITGVPTVREPDGLALSSRNRYLSPSERQLAKVLSAALRAGAAAGGEGPQAVLSAARAELGTVQADYVELRSPDLGPVPRSGEARLLIAARIGAPRLIDNASVHLGSGK